MNESGVPVSFEQGKGYFIVNGYFLPPVSFTSEEANALLLMEAVVKGFSDHSIQKHYATALNKVKTVLRSTQQDKLETLASRIRLQVPECMTLQVSYLSVLQEAITARTMIQIAYLNKNQEPSVRKVEPIGLVFYAFAWHLIAWCHKRNGYRDFKLARIQKLTNTSTPFIHRKHISLDKYMKDIPVEYRETEEQRNRRTEKQKNRVSFKNTLLRNWTFHCFSVLLFYQFLNGFLRPASI